MANLFNNVGGGNALPPFIQGRKPVATTPMVTPPSTVAPGESAGGAPTPPMLSNAQPGAPTSTPGGPTPPGTPGPQTLYDFFKKDLEDKRKSAKANATADASARGVFYGSPLTTSYGDIDTEFLRGLGSLQAGITQNEYGNELSRLGIASNLLNNQPLSGGGGVDPATLQALGGLFAPQNSPRMGPTDAINKKSNG